MRHQVTLPRRDLLKMGAAGLLGTLIAASTTNRLGAQTPNVEAVISNLRSIRFGSPNPNYASQWAVRLAQALGYLQDGGIQEIEVIQTDEYLPGLIGESLNFAHGDTSTFLGGAAASGLPVKVIAIYRDKESWIMGVRKGIDTPGDLRGKTITGGPLSGRSTWVQRQILKKMGLDPDTDVVFVPSSGGSDSRLGAVLTGTVDAASLFPRHKKPLEEAGGKFLFAESVAVPQEAYGAMGNWISQNEDATYAFIREDIRARQWLLKPENEDRAYQIMIDYGYEISDHFRGLYKSEIERLSPDGGFASAEVMDEFIAQLKDSGEIPASLDWRQHVDLKYVWAAQDALGLPRRPASI